MSKVLTFSRVFPTTHPKAGQPTYFVEKIYNNRFSKNNLMGYPKGLEIDDTIMGVKKHTIRNGNRWKVGDKFSPRVWSGKPYCSKQIIIAGDITIQALYDITFVPADELLIVGDYNYYPNGYEGMIKLLATNDGLSVEDFKAWFNKPFIGQIICWDDPKYN